MRRGCVLSGGVAGLLAAALALGVAELIAALLHPRSSPVVAVGAAFIEHTPVWLETFAVRVFGSYDKVALVAGILLVLAGFAVGVGRLGQRRVGVAMAGVAALGVVGAAAAVTRDGASWAWALPAALGAAAGCGALYLLTPEWARRTAAMPGNSAGRSDPGGTDRRRFLLASASVAAMAGVTGTIGRMLPRGGLAAVSPGSDPAPAASGRAAAPAAAGADLDIPGLPPFFTPNEDFYRVDTALVLPRVPRREWTLRVHGMVDRELELSYQDLLRRPLIQRAITLACVSNPVGGPYVGNARWLGVRLADVLREAGVRPGADEVLSRSADGWTCGTPTEVVMDGRDAMLAVAMNGEPLPVAHGFPVRMVVPGLYGYVSATKWVVDIELTRFARRFPYWAKRGWALRAPVRTMSRIDTPRPTAAVAAGRVPVAGVAWAPHRGIRRVEVRIDGGPWHEARLAPVPSAATWRQWVHYWDATPGEHQLQVRATDGRGRTQTRERSDPYPDGATGWHTVAVTVT